MCSRGKSALELDLKSADGLQKALDLAARTDVVLKNFRPAVMDRLGLGATLLPFENQIACRSDIYFLVVVSIPAGRYTKSKH